MPGAESITAAAPPSGNTVSPASGEILDGCRPPCSLRRTRAVGAWLSGKAFQVLVTWTGTAQPGRAAGGGGDCLGFGRLDARLVPNQRSCPGAQAGVTLYAGEAASFTAVTCKNDKKQDKSAAIPRCVGSPGEKPLGDAARWGPSPALLLRHLRCRRGAEQMDPTLGPVRMSSRPV